MRSGTWNGARTTDNVRVTVNGTVRPVKDVSIQSGMKDGHPAAETSSWCIEATIEWADLKTVTADSPHPFGEGTDWLPQTGDEVVVETGDGALDQWWVQHRGVIDSTSGSIADGTAVSRTVDDVEELDKPVQYSAMLSTMTPVQDGEPLRYQGMQAIWYVDRMLRDESSGARGWHATPPVTWQTIANATGIGSLRPEVGTLLKAASSTDPNVAPSWTTTADGHPYPEDYQTINTFKGGVTTRKFVLTFAISGNTGAGTAGFFYVRDADLGAGPVISDQGTGAIKAWHHGQEGTPLEAPINGARRVAVRYERISSSDQRMTLRFDDGREFTHNTTTGTLPTNWAADRIRVDSGDAIGWWVLEGDKPDEQSWFQLDHVPTARFRVNGFNWWYASRDQPRESAADAIAQQLEAECAAAWLDEDGHFQWAGRDVLDTQAPAQTVASTLDLDDVAWDTKRRAGARSVALRYLHPRVERDVAGGMSRTFWTSDTIDLDPGEEEVVAVSVPEDEDWIADDTTPHHIYQYGQPWDHYWRHSTFGGTQYRKSNTDEAAWCQFIDCTMTKTGLRDFEVKFRPWSTISSVYRISSSWPPTTTNVPKNSSPLTLRGRCRLVWQEREERLGTGNSLAGPRYVHDVGWRMQDRGASLTDLLDWLAVELGDPKPTVSVTLAHDPRRQVGDKVRVEDRDVTGTWVEMLVQERDTNVGGFTDTVRGRVTAHGDLSDVSLLSPSGHTALTPEGDWNRDGEVA